MLEKLDYKRISSQIYWDILASRARNNLIAAQEMILSFAELLLDPYEKEHA
jgi:hypothetical protein